MIKLIFWTLLLLAIFHKAKCDEESCAKNYVDYLNAKLLQTERLLTQFSWAYDSNISDETAKDIIIIDERAARESRIAKNELNKFHNYTTFKDEDLKRQIKLFLSNSELSLPTGKFIWLEQLIKTMINTYEKAKVLKYSSETDYLTSEEVVEEFFIHPDKEIVKYYWIGIANATGPKIREHYIEYVKLINESAQILGFENAYDMTIRNTENINIKEEVLECIQTITPFYKNLRAYVWKKLLDLYGPEIIPGDHIPMHVLGHLHASTWEFVWDSTQPFRTKTLLRESTILGAKPMKVVNLYRSLDNFLKGMNLSGMPESFWKESIFKKIPGRLIISSPKAYDFFNNDDYRIIHASEELTQTSFDNVFRLMGNILLRKTRSHLPTIYRVNVNPMFVRFGTVLRLAFTNTDILQKFQYIESRADDKDHLNLLHFTAMTDIPCLIQTFVLLVFKYNLYTGTLQFEDLNCHYWKLQQQYSGLEAPIDRSETDFDLGTKQQIIRNLRFIDSFISKVASYQIFRHLCEITGEWSRDSNSKPLHLCDLEGKVKAGNALHKLLSFGWSKPYTEILASMTGSGKLDGTAMLDYFKPLYNWLVQKNLEENTPLDWSNPTTKCVK